MEIIAYDNLLKQQEKEALCGVKRIKFKSSRRVAKIDIETFQAWERGNITAEEAAERIRKNNNLKELEAYDFVQVAFDLGYWR